MDVRKFFIVILSSIMCCMVVAQSPKQQGSGGKLKFLNKVHDFGTIYRDNDLKCQIYIRQCRYGASPYRICPSRLPMYEI